MNGILLLNKDKNKTSRDMINKLVSLFNMKKIGHTGTLDPLATGVLVVCIGKYTKLINHLELLKKEYIATVKLGILTDTLDITGNILEKKDCSVSRKDVQTTINSLIGPYKQTIPIYSAKKVNGKKLYEYARSGEEVSLPTNEVEIYDLSLTSFNGDEFTFKACVSKGTYIRALIQTICEKLNVIGTMSDLVRTGQGAYSINDSYTISDIENGNYKLLKAKDVLNYPIYNLDDEEFFKVKNGSKMNFDNNNEFILLMYNDEEIAIYKKENDIYRVSVMLI